MTARQTGPIPEMIGPYVVIARIGSGGMATVYRAYHRLGGSPVALKVLAPHLADLPAFRVRFEREAYTLRQFDHPHILPVYDYGQDGDLVFLVMRLVEGRSLADVLRAGPLPIEEVGRYTREIASALDYAHARGIIHRDIKPPNILLDTDDSVLLADFGVAYATASGDRLTSAGSFVGTAGYASPEQCRGEPLDRRSDIYALAVLAFQMATRRLPFESTSALAVIKMHLSENPPNPLAFNPSLPLALYDVLSRGMAKDPNDRYPSAMKFSEALDAALGLHALPQTDGGEHWLVGNIAPLTFEEPDEAPGSAEDAAHTRAKVERPAVAPERAQPVEERSLATPTPGEGPILLPPPVDEPAEGASAPGIDEVFGPVYPVQIDERSTRAPAAANPLPETVREPEPAPQPAQATPVKQRSAMGETAAPMSSGAPVIRPIAAPAVGPAPRRSRLPVMGVAIAAAVLLATIVVVAVLLSGGEPDEPPTLNATYVDLTLGLTLDYPGAWHVAVGLVAALSADPTATIQLSDRDIAAGGPYGEAKIAIQVQQIDPIAVYQLPPACQALIRAGPQETFACMAREGYATPVYEPFATARTAGVRLPGALPVTRASIPAILLPTGDGPWIAVLIAHWDGYPHARAVLEAVARSIR